MARARIVGRKQAANVNQPAPGKTNPNWAWLWDWVLALPFCDTKKNRWKVMMYSWELVSLVSCTSPAPVPKNLPLSFNKMSLGRSLLS